MSNGIAKISIIEGDSIEKVRGQHTEYVGKMTYSSSQKLVTTAEGGKRFGDKPEDPPKTDGRIIDIVMFVAGTTDPINTEGKKHQANTSYWKYIDEETKKETEQSLNNLWNKLKEIKYQFLDLHIEGDFFSWSGDNDTSERIKASERLFDIILRTYPNWKNQEVHLHLIGHSHGGNVINQFTELISSKDMIAKSTILKPRKIAEFPKPWKVKSITYLSTPFFQKKHQLNHSKLHKDCKIINVHNEYDLTQQLIANFSLNNLEGLLKSFKVDRFTTGITIVKDVKKDIIMTYLKSLIWQDFKNKAILAWREMSNAFLGFNIITAEFIKYINSLKIENSNLQKEKETFVNLLNNLQQWTYDVHKNYSSISGGYDKSTWAKNLNLSQGLSVLNILFDIKTGPKDSYLLSLLAGIFGESKGITDSIDETLWSPSKQTKGLPIIDVPIFESDPYNSRNKRKEFDAFLKGVQGAVHKRELEDMLMRLLSQFVKPSMLALVVLTIDMFIEPLIFGKLDTEVTKLRKNLEVYSKFVSKYHAYLVTPKDEKAFAKDIMNAPGSISYLAMASHSLSHTQLWKRVEDGLKDSFSSGKNPGYRKKI
ncbi:hypothetical protein [Chryseobacterium pennipullorum]|uniref:Alpha/beta hydrolase n=1 Tax=Chryseobacterium pennipullorum TaxID=2258963 RepID=A0A3D9AXU6_9FLAO|nr:hypothetical protein [Chryseobacterium pennipullorum]REC46151.1 hypothetical protein DRF67_15470 [Chryseobacterium pennipullorum]